MPPSVTSARQPVGLAVSVVLAPGVVAEVSALDGGAELLVEPPDALALGDVPGVGVALVSVGEGVPLSVGSLGEEEAVALAVSLELAEGDVDAVTLLLASGVEVFLAFGVRGASFFPSCPPLLAGGVT